jgi:hypothetical protein
MPAAPRLTNTQVALAPTQEARQDFTANQIGPIVSDAAQRLAQVGLQVYEYDRKQKITQLSLGTQKELQDFQLSLETDRDYDTQPERYRQKVSEITQRVQGSIKDQRLVRAWQVEMAGEVAKGEFEVKRNALKGKVGEQRAVLNQNLDNLAVLAGAGDDERVRSKGLVALDEAYQAGILSPEELQSRAQKFRSDVVVAGVRREILNDPDLAEQRLLQGDFPDLAGQDRVTWTERAAARADSLRRQRLAEEDRSIRLQDRADRDREKATAKTGDQLVANGGLSAQWVEDNRDNLSPDDFRYFYRKLSGEDTATDAMVYSALRERAGRGEDVRDEARQALQRNQIKTTDYDRLVGEVEQQRPGWYKRGSQFITTSSAVSDLNPDPAAAQRKAAMLDDWYRWSTENPKATDDQAEREYKRIVKEYGIIDLSNLTLTKRAPTYLVGTRNAPDIDASEAATVKAFKDGLMDRPEFERQAKLLAEWRQAVQRSQPEAVTK